jgi:hypothetical protein
VTHDWSRSLAEAGQHLLPAFALEAGIVCLLAAVALLWHRAIQAFDRRRAVYYVGRRASADVGVYVVVHGHVDRLMHPERSALPDPAWGTGAQTEPLAAALLWHHTRRRDPTSRQLRTLGMWLELQPGDGFVLHSAELAQIVGAALPRRPSVRPRSDGALRTP